MKFYKKIKTKLKHSISYILVLAVLLPFAVQFVHSFEVHEHACTAQNKIHFDSHEFKCAVFHFKINSDTPVDFKDFTISFKNNILSKPWFTEIIFTSLNLHYKSSRAPPFLLV